MGIRIGFQNTFLSTCLTAVHAAIIFGTVFNSANSHAASSQRTRNSPAFGGASPSGAQTCTDLAAAQRLIDSYGIDLKSLGSSPETLSADLCSPTSKIRMLIETYQLLVSATVAPYHSGIVTEPYGVFVRRLSPSTTLDTDYKTCGENPLAAACHLPSGPAQMFLRPRFFDFPVVDRVSILIHESHHGTGSTHVRCRRGSKKGSDGACDPSFQSHGAYAAGLEYLARVALTGTNVDPVSRAAARAMGTISIANDFNQFDAPTQSFLLLLNQPGTALIRWDGEHPVQTLRLTGGALGIGVYTNTQNIRTALIQSRNLSDSTRALDLSLPFSPDSLVSSSTILDALPEFGINDNNAIMIKSAITVDKSVYQLNSTGIDVRTFSDSPVAAPFPSTTSAAQGNDVPSKFIDISPSYNLVRLVDASPCGSTGAFALGYKEQGAPLALFKINTNGIEESDCLWPTQLMTLTKLNNVFYGLTTNGSLIRWNPSSHSSQPVSEFANQTFNALHGVVTSTGLTQVLAE